jgi:hypothetical protein
LGLILQRKATNAAGSEEPLFTRSEWQRAAWMFGLLVIYAVLLSLLGFYVATPFMVFILYHQIAGPGKRGPLAGLICAAVVTGMIYVVFTVLLNSFLPAGSLF